MGPKPDARAPVPEQLRLAIGVFFGAILVARTLWSGIVYPESNVFILIALALVLALLILVSAFSRSTGWRFGLPEGSALLYLCVILILSLTSARVWLARDFLFQVAACTAAYFIATNLSGSRTPRLAVCAGLCAGAVTVALYALYQRFWGLAETRILLSREAGPWQADPAFMSRALSHAVFSTFFYPNALAGYLIAVIPLACAVIFLRKEDIVPLATGVYLCALAVVSIARGFYADLYAKPLLFLLIYSAAAILCGALAIGSKKGVSVVRMAAVPLLLLPLWALALTASEGAWIALITSAALCPILVAGKYRFAAGLALLMAVMAAAVCASGLVPEALRDSLGARFGYWRAALEIWRRNPWAGMGPGSFAIGYARFRLASSEEGRLAHSIYLGLAAETGIIGLAAFSCLWLSLLGSLAAAARKKKQLALAALVASCAFLIHGAADVSLSVPGITLTVWALAGLGVGASADPQGMRRPSAAAAVALSLLILGAVLSLAAPRALAELHRLRAARFIRSAMNEAARAEILRAIEIEPRNADYWSLLADAEQRLGGDAAAFSAYDRAATLGGDVGSHRLRLALCLWRLSENGKDGSRAEKARQELRAAISSSPHDAETHLLLAFWLETDGRTNEALLEYREGLRLIEAALDEPNRVRRRSPAEYEVLAEKVREKIKEMEERQ